MAVHSTMLPLGTTAPPFSLPDVVSGRTVTLETFTEQDVLVVMFICRHCPFVKHIQSELVRLGDDYRERSVGLVAVSANDPATHPDDAPERLAEMASSLGLSYPLCFDESQAVAKAYHAACTPDFFVFDRARRLVYRGQLDDSRPGGDVPVTGRDLRAAIEAVLEGRPVAGDQRPSVGCGIKWRA